MGCAGSAGYAGCPLFGRPAAFAVPGCLGCGGRLVSLVSWPRGSALRGGRVPGWQVFLWSFGFRVLWWGRNAGSGAPFPGELSPEGPSASCCVGMGTTIKPGGAGLRRVCGKRPAPVLVFFPGYVWAVRLLRLLIRTPRRRGCSSPACAASGGNCYGLQAGPGLRGPCRGAGRPVLIFPCSLLFFSSLMMTEGLFLLASAGACYYAAGAWILYGVFGAAAALTRMTGLLVIFPLSLSCWRESGPWRLRQSVPSTAGEGCSTAFPWCCSPLWGQRPTCCSMPGGWGPLCLCEAPGTLVPGVFMGLSGGGVYGGLLRGECAALSGMGGVVPRPGPVPGRDAPSLLGRPPGSAAPQLCWPMGLFLYRLPTASPGCSVQGGISPAASPCSCCWEG